MTSLCERIETAVMDDPENGVFRCRHDIFTNPSLFEIETKHICEGTLVYLAHESRIPGADNWFSSWAGRL